MAIEGGGKKEGERKECTRAILGPRMCEDLQACRSPTHYVGT